MGRVDRGGDGEGDGGGEGELTVGVWPPEASIPSPQTSLAIPFGPDAQVVWGQVGRFKHEFVRK